MKTFAVQPAAHLDSRPPCIHGMLGNSNCLAVGDWVCKAMCKADLECRVNYLRRRKQL